MTRVAPVLAVLTVMLAGAPAAHADLVVSTAATSAVSASGTDNCTFTATQAAAVLDVSALDTCLTGSGSATVRTVISGISIQAPIAGGATSTLLLNTTVGAITQSAAAGATVTAGTLTANADAGVDLGAVANPVSNLMVRNTATSPIVFAGALPLSVEVASQTAAADVVLSSDASIDLAGPVSTPAASAVRIQAASAITQSAGTISGGLLTATSGNGDVTLDAANAVDRVQLTELGGGALTFSDGTRPLAIADTRGGPAGLRIASGPQTIVGAITAAGPVDLAADQLAFGPGGSVSAPGQTVSIRPASAGRSVVLGAASGSGQLGLTSAGLDAIDAGRLALGDSDAGPVVVAGAQAPAHLGALVLAGSGGLRGQDTTSSITVPMLTVDSAAPARTWTITPGSLDDGGGAPVGLRGVSTLAIDGSADGDTFALTPAASTDYVLDGGAGAKGILRLDPQGRPVSGTTSPPDGTITTADDRTVSFGRMAQVSVVAAPAPAPPAPAPPAATQQPPPATVPAAPPTFPGRTPVTVPTRTFRPEPAAPAHESAPAATRARAVPVSGRVIVTLPGRRPRLLSGSFADLPAHTRISACKGTVLLFAGRGRRGRRAGAFSRGRLTVVSARRGRLTLRLAGSCGRARTLTADADGPFVVLAPGTRTAPVRSARWKLTVRAGRTTVRVVRGSIHAAIRGRTTTIRAGRSRTT